VRTEEGVRVIYCGRRQWRTHTDAVRPTAPGHGGGQALLPLRSRGRRGWARERERGAAGPAARLATGVVDVPVVAAAVLP
jgi:hypothetical protein